MSEFVETYRAGDDSTVVNDRDGIGWYDAPVPRRFHRCRAQTEGTINYFTAVRRCACGAISLDGGRWMGRNQR